MILPTLLSNLFALSLLALALAAGYIAIELLRLHFRLKRLEQRAEALVPIPKIEWPKTPRE